MFHDIRLTSRKISRRLELIEPLVYRRRQPLPHFRHLKLESPLVEPPVSPQVDDSDWQPIPWGSYWCEPHADFVLRTRFQIPPDWNVALPIINVNLRLKGPSPGRPGDGAQSLIDTNALPIALHLPIGKAGDFSHPEALAYIDGVPYAACDRHHQEILLPNSPPSVPLPPQSPQLWGEGGQGKACPNTQYPISIFDGATHLLALHGWAGSLRNDRDARLLMRECALVQIDQPTRDFIALARVALGVADHLDENEPARGHLYTALDEAFKVLDTREPFDERFYASVPAAHETLRKGIALAGAPLDVNITAVGHAHIDVAWLWTLGQTRRKAGRTFYNVMRLMEQFPEFHFSQSQPQLYDFVRQDYPELFEIIKQRVRDGRWEPLGGMWVEADCNITGAESLARQFLLGLTFFRDHFGADAVPPVQWLPDVFGYAWNLPQLIKEAGLEYFFTIKIGWNEYNRLPYDSFWWQGLDGTRALTHFSTTSGSGEVHVSTYNANASPEQTLQTWRNFQQKDWGQPGVTPPLLMSFGYGDGGGGPTREMVENIREMGHFPATPQIKCGKVGEFFRKLEADVGDRLPTWNGELYLENHRGTYTTQSRNKRANRKSEFLLHDAEFLAALASLLDPGYRYPHAELRQAWELVCLNQFHDIIPGSSIGPVYVESLQQYAEVHEIGERVRDNALAAIAEKLGGDVLVVNPTSFERSDLVFWSDPGIENPSSLGLCGDKTPESPTSWGGGTMIPNKFGTPTLQRTDGSPIPIQPVQGGLLLAAGELPPYSITPLLFTTSSNFQPPTSNFQHLTATPTLLENDYLRVELDAAGDIIRIYDKLNDRDVLPAGAIANQFQAFEDRPINPDAWDIDIFYDDKLWLAEPAESVRAVENGPLRATLEVRRRILNSEYVQRISLAHNSPRLDFDTTIQWRERHILLKVAFPVDVLSPQATYEIQWGNVQRPTHRNTSWDWARFETCAQKWVDLSEGGYGVSLLNDCKYGHDIHDNVMRISLLRSPTTPDPEADQGEHRFAYSLLPHKGGWGERTVAEAYALNDPLVLWASPSQDTQHATRNTQYESLISVDQPNIVIETVKQAEDGQGVIVRLYESQRRRGEFTLTVAFPLADAWRTNLLEENQVRIDCSDNRSTVYIKPYQILTLRLIPQTQ